MTVTGYASELNLTIAAGMGITCRRTRTAELLRNEIYVRDPVRGRCSAAWAIQAARGDEGWRPRAGPSASEEVYIKRYVEQPCVAANIEGPGVAHH